MTTRLKFIDIARALCMIYIIGFWHLSGYIESYDLTGMFTSGLTKGALATFAFISAYFLGKKNVTTFKDVLDFWSKRLLRVYPLFFISCTSLLLVYYVLGNKYITGFGNYVFTLTGIAVFIGQAPSTVWFISMLLVFYFITPLLLLLKIKLRVIAVVVIYAVLFTIHLLGLPMDGRVVYLFLFYGGATVYSLVQPR